MIKIHINGPWIVSIVSIVTNRRCAILKAVSPRFSAQIMMIWKLEVCSALKKITIRYSFPTKTKLVQYEKTIQTKIFNNKHNEQG